MNRLGLKIFCFLVAVIIWIQVAGGHVVVREVRLPLDLAGLQPGLTLVGNEWPDSVPVRAQGSKWQFFLNRYFGRDLGHVMVDLGQVEAPTDLLREITVNDVESPLADLDISPPLWLRLNVDRLDSLRVPVAVHLVGVLPGDRMLMEPVTAEPDSVVLTGPTRFLDGAAARTEPLDLAKQRDSARPERRIVASDPFLNPRPEAVELALSVAPVASRNFEHVPVVPLVDAGQPSVEVFPPVANLTVRGPADSVRVVTAADLSVTVSLTGLEPGVHHLGAQVLLPERFGLVSLEPDEFMVVIGNGAGAGGDR